MVRFLLPFVEYHTTSQYVLGGDSGVNRARAAVVVLSLTTLTTNAVYTQVLYYSTNILLCMSTVTCLLSTTQPGTTEVRTVLEYIRSYYMGFICNAGVFPTSRK